MDRVQIKARAKEQIRGNVLMYFLVSLIVGLVGNIPAVGQILLLPVLVMGVVYIELDMRDGKSVDVGRVFDAFHDFGRAWCVNFLVGLYTALWTLLFVIPGIVKSFSYAMAPYIVAENPDITANDAITKSRKMMDGHKLDLFVLRLSFIGWVLLGIFTFGLAFIYAVPYMRMAEVNFYDSIKNERIEF